MSAHLCMTLTPGCYRCDLHLDELRRGQQEELLLEVRRRYNVKPRANYRLNHVEQPSLVSVELSWDDFHQLVLRALKGET